MLGWVLPGGLWRRKLSRMDMGGIGRGIIAREMRSKQVSDLPALIAMAVDGGEVARHGRECVAAGDHGFFANAIARHRFFFSPSLTSSNYQLRYVQCRRLLGGVRWRVNSRGAGGAHAPDRKQNSLPNAGKNRSFKRKYKISGGFSARVIARIGVLRASSRVLRTVCSCAHACLLVKTIEFIFCDANHRRT